MYSDSNCQCLFSEYKTFKKNSLIGVKSAFKGTRQFLQKVKKSSTGQRKVSQF